MKTLDVTRVREIFVQRLINRFAKGGEMMRTPRNPVLNPVDGRRRRAFIPTLTNTVTYQASYGSAYI